MTTVKEIANSGKYAVEKPPVHGFLVLADSNIKFLPYLDLFFQKLWIYPGVASGANLLAANAGTVYVGLAGWQVNLAAVTLAVSGLTVTVTATGHGLSVGTTRPMSLSGATPTEFNGKWQMNVLDANTLSFTLPHPPDKTAVSGTITAEWQTLLVVLPDWLPATDPATGLPGMPLKYELPLGQKMRLSNVFVKGTAGDGVFYTLWG
jgi:hypothetical protein